MKKLIPYIFALVFLFSACGTKDHETSLVSLEESEESQAQISEEPSVPAGDRSIYSGLKVSPEKQKAKPLMVMVDNAKPARPQANLSKASIIWEMRVEGADTRYMALFEKPDEGETFLLGPIRSARPNFITRAHQYGAVFVHHGASSDGDAFLKELGMKNLDGMTLIGKLHFRYKDTKKRAPHNSYAYIDKAYDTYVKKGGELTNNGKGFLFNEDFKDLPGGDPANKLNVRYSKLDDITYEYDDANKTYKRIREGKLMVDELTGTEVRATNIIVQVADSYIYDKKGHMAFNDVGRGQGYLISGGKCVKINWEKSDDHVEPTKFTYENGEEIKLNPGQTWIQVVDKRMKVLFE